jgi:hypothetical protein
MRLLKRLLLKQQAALVESTTRVRHNLLNISIHPKLSGTTEQTCFELAPHPEVLQFLPESTRRGSGKRFVLRAEIPANLKKNGSALFFVIIASSRTSRPADDISKNWLANSQNHDPYRVR